MRYRSSNGLQHRSTSIITCILLCIGGLHSNAFAQSASDGQTGAAMSAEARALRIQELEREAAQYRASVDLLRANGADMEGAAIRALAGELKDIREEIAALQRQRQANTETASTSAPSASGNSDAARLKQLLAAHYEEEAEYDASSADAAAVEMEEAVVTLDGYKVRLSGNEGVLAVQQIDERLGNTASGERVRARDLVFHVETRLNGALVTSRSHNLRALGQDQYVARIPLNPGTARITVRGDEWQVELDSTAGGEYLITLYRPDDNKPQLHLIPLTDLEAATMSELPSWLPARGAGAAPS